MYLENPFTAEETEAPLVNLEIFDRNERQVQWEPCEKANVMNRLNQLNAQGDFTQAAIRDHRTNRLLAIATRNGKGQVIVKGKKIK